GTHPLTVSQPSLANAHPTPTIYSLSLHDALPILASTHRESSSASRHYHSPVRSCCRASGRRRGHAVSRRLPTIHGTRLEDAGPRSEEHTSELQSRENLVCRLLLEKKKKNARGLPR